MDKNKINSKYLLNSLESNVRDHLLGLAMTNPNVQIAEGVDAIIRKDINILRNNGHVLIVSGGGAGHEPMFAGFVGPKLLSAAVSGSYFASPSAGSIMKLIEQIAGYDTQVLLIQANYTGDRLNFGLAKEYLTLNSYKNIGWFVFGDDLAPLLSNFADDQIEIKRRGLAGITFIHKIAGVLSERGHSLKEILDYLNRFSKLIYTFSVSLSPADIPGHGASFHLEPDQMELGLGVHGESGVKRIKMLPANETVKLILDELIGYLNKHELLEQYNRRIALIINNLGGLIPMELNIILKEVVILLSSQHIQIERIYFGSLFTSFNMKGVSFSLLLVDDFIIDVLDESDNVVGSMNPKTINQDFIYKSNFKPSSENILNDQRKLFDICKPEIYIRCMTNACNSIIKNESSLNKLDETVGDSDCGSTLSSIAKLFLGEIDSNDDHPPTFATLSKIVNNNIGGTSGAIYSILLTSAHHFIQTYSSDTIGKYEKKILFWLELLQHSIKKISTYGGAKINDRSMIDGLYGIVLGLEQCNNNNTSNESSKPLPELARIVAESTWTQAKKTASMKANVGRAAYVNETLVVNPDAGAYAVAIWVQAISDTLATFQIDCAL